MPCAAQENKKWYADMPGKAELYSDSAVKIDGKIYRIYNAYDPIAPKGGEKVIDFAGTLDYYMWFHKVESLGRFTMSKIDGDLNIYYYDEDTKEFVSPQGFVLKD
jgi:hypothetical protein